VCRFSQWATSDAHRHFDVLCGVELRQQVMELKNDPDVSIAESH